MKAKIEPTIDNDGNTWKTCSKCGYDRPMDRFYRDKSKKDGRHTVCKDCCDAGKRRRNRENPVAAAEYMRKYKAEHKEHYKKLKKDWYENNKEHVKELADKRKNEDRTKWRAQKRFNEAVRRGAIKREPCEVCGCDNAEGHHPDYDQWDYVWWMCKRHHLGFHGLVNRGLHPDEAYAATVESWLREQAESVVS